MKTIIAFILMNSSLTDTSKMNLMRIDALIINIVNETGSSAYI